MKKTIILFIILASIFLLFPQIDIKFSSLFFDGKFFLAEHPFVKFLYHLVVYIIITFTILLISLLIANLIFKKDFFNIGRKKLIYLLVSLIIGPILVINLVFKENWGRARPKHTDIFGGDKNFTPAFIISNNCDTNCSFVCGHASAGFYFLTLIPLFRRKKLIASLALGYGGVIGLVRIVQGGHFLSDVIFSAFFIYFSYKVIYYLIFEKNMIK